MRRNKWLRPAGESGSIMVEFVLLMPLLAVMILFLLVSYELINNSIEMQVETFADLRQKSMDIERGDDWFQMVSTTTRRVVVVEGTLPRIIRHNYIPQQYSLSTYAGSVKGNNKSRFYRRNDRYTF